MDEEAEYDYVDEVPYQPLDEVDFSLTTSGIKWLPFYEDDLYLGMQAMNVGLSDCHITQMEYHLLHTYVEIEKTPGELAMTVGALSQMWAYGAYEILRMWRDRRYHFNKWYSNGAVPAKLESLGSADEYMNLTVEVRKKQLAKYMNDSDYRDAIDSTWQKLEPAYRIIELYRINLAKHCAPGEDNVIPRAPGYGRINMWCGALDYELVGKDGIYETFNRRDLADCLRLCVKNAQQGAQPDASGTA